MGQEDDVKQEEDDSETEDEEDEALLRDPVGNYEKSLSYHNGSDNSEAGESIRLLFPSFESLRQRTDLVSFAFVRPHSQQDLPGSDLQAHHSRGAQRGFEVPSSSPVQVYRGAFPLSRFGFVSGTSA